MLCVNQLVVSMYQAFDLNCCTSGLLLIDLHNYIRIFCVNQLLVSIMCVPWHYVSYVFQKCGTFILQWVAYTNLFAEKYSNKQFACMYIY
jgi:hypothetical protein